MGPKPAGSQSADMFRQRLDELVNLKHPLAQLSTHIDWSVFEREWAGHFPSSRGRPATSTRLIAGLLYLQHTFALSDEDVVWGWVENPYWVRRETGKAQVVKVHCDEGVANNIGPEPCVAIREGVREASVGEHAGQPWSHEMVYFPDADVLQYAEGNTYERAIASARRSGVVVEPGMHGHALRGNREISRPASRNSGLARIGKARSRSR